MVAAQNNGTIVLRVHSLDEPSVWREVELLEQHTLHDLHGVLQEAFELHDDHLYAFYLNNTAFDQLFDYQSPRTLQAKRRTDQTQLGSLPLKVNKRFLYLFDFGDELAHEVRVLRRGETAADTSYPRIVAAEGDAPAQYAFEDDEELEDDDSDGSDDEQVGEADSEEHDGGGHCHHDEFEGTIDDAVRAALERTIPDVERAVADHRAHKSRLDEAFDRDEPFDVDEDDAANDNTTKVAAHSEGSAPGEDASLPALTDEQLLQQYELAKEVVRSANGDIDVVHLVVEHAIDENVVGWLFQLPDTLADAELYDAAVDLAEMLHAAEPTVGMDHSIPAYLLAGGRVEQADAALVTPLAEDPDNADLLELKAEIERAKGNSQAAIDHYRAALEWCGSDLEQRAEIMAPLCELLEASANPEAVLELQRRELELIDSLRRRYEPSLSAGTVRRERPKVGRNDPCTCGSGKKYKKCCGAA